MTREHKKYLKEFSRCELCGSPKALELHHIIPTTFGGPNVIDNWIAICHGCHAKLTPRSILIKHGMYSKNKPVEDFQLALIQDLEEAKQNEDYFFPDFDWAWDIFKSIFMNENRPVYSFYVGDKT